MVKFIGNNKYKKDSRKNESLFYILRIIVNIKNTNIAIDKKIPPAPSIVVILEKTTNKKHDIKIKHIYPFITSKITENIFPTLALLVFFV